MKRTLIALTAFLVFSGCGAKSDGGASAAAHAGSEAEEPLASEPLADPSASAEQLAAAPAAATETTNAAPLAAPALWKVDAGKSTLAFTGTQTGKSFTGRFSRFDAAIRFDPQNLDASSIEVSVDMTSGTTGDRQRDDALPSGDWFAASSFPEATFTSSEIAATGANVYEARGTLKIRDASKDLALRFTLDINGDRAIADGSTTLIRTDYGVGQGEFAGGEWVGLEVTVDYHIEATR